jgi:hypothetical protein
VEETTTSMHGRNIIVLIAVLAAQLHVTAQEHSIARQWNEALLNAIKRDFARPPVQARNLYQVSAAMYEAWAAYDPKAEPFLLGRTRSGYTCPFDGIAIPTDVEAARHEAISFAAYRMIAHRFQNSPGVFLTTLEINALMSDNGYITSNTSVDYVQGGPAELGNYIAQQIIAYGMQDGSNESVNFQNQYYTPSNPPLIVAGTTVPANTDPNLWQPLTLTNAVDQQGNPIPSTPPFQSPEWGNVDPFALTPAQMTEHVRNGNIYKVYNDPGAPPLLDTTVASELNSFYKWNHCMVPIWQSHLDANDTTMIDISPASKGNVGTYPQTEQEIRDFYDYYNGGDISTGHSLNPVSGQPYQPQIVKRGDYARVLAEFWADGPTSETPPGHWFSIMHTAMDHPLFERKWMGQGPILSELEYDVKAHLVLGGSLHDAAITAWGIKGWYDYTRPVTAIRYMASKGQSSDPMLPNFHPAGLPIIPGYMELVEAGDPLEGANGENIGKMKLYSWRGHEFIQDPQTDEAGVGWILAEKWFPYQRPTFVTPPFAGYISGHSTYSRTAAEVLTLMTGSEYFPGGMGTFPCQQDQFLVFEDGPSQTLELQWATYRDASDQCSLSRIWGGIHPPIDDIPGRHLGMIVGPQAFNYGTSLFNNGRPAITDVTVSDPVINAGDIGQVFTVQITYDLSMDQASQPSIDMLIDDPVGTAVQVLGGSWIDEDTYELQLEVLDSEITLDDIHLRVDSAVAIGGMQQDVWLIQDAFIIDTEYPEVVDVTSSTAIINEVVATQGMVYLDISFSEPCDVNVQPSLNWADAVASLSFNGAASSWLNDQTFRAIFNVQDLDLEVGASDIGIADVLDKAGNPQIASNAGPFFTTDTRAPELAGTILNDAVLAIADVGPQALQASFTFDEPMDMSIPVEVFFENGSPVGTSLIMDAASAWIDEFTYEARYDLVNATEEFPSLQMLAMAARDAAGNLLIQTSPIALQIDTKVPELISATPSHIMVADSEVGTNDLHIDLVFDDTMDPSVIPLISIECAEDVSGSLSHEPSLDEWINGNTYRVHFTVQDEGREVDLIGISASAASDDAGNGLVTAVMPGIFSLDTRDPLLVMLTASTYTVTNNNVGDEGLQFLMVFDEPMMESMIPSIGFSMDVTSVLQLDSDASGWLNAFTYRSVYDVVDEDVLWLDIDVMLADAGDVAGNDLEALEFTDLLDIDLLQVGISEADRPVFTTHPNPVQAGGTLFFQFDGTTDDITLNILDLQGNSIHRTRPAMRNGTAQITVPDIAAGIYLLSVEKDGSIGVERFIVLR